MARCGRALEQPLLVVILAVTAGCAARATNPQAAALAEGDALVRQGCYDCLLEARTRYEEAGRAALVRRLEVELLLTLREKELAIDEAATFARAEALALELGPDVDARPYLDMVRAVPPDPVGTPRGDQPRAPLLAGREGLASARAAIEKSPFGPLFREYLATAVQCGRPSLDPAGEDVPRPGGDAPLILYRRAVCENPIDVEALEQVRAAVPRFVETSLFAGRAEMGRLFSSDGSAARALFEEAYARFPQSPSVTYHLATLAQAGRDCRRAEQFFTATLALREAHEDARLGRAICRTYLADVDGAIADATVLIDAVAYNRAEGHYWRAWNHRTRKQLDLARADIDRSRALLYNARVLTLAGMIEHDQADFDRAREDLTRARDMDSRECQARWYLGLVGYSTEAWPESAAGFADAADCYARLIAEAEAQRALMVARTDVTEEFRAQQLAGFDAAIAEDSTQRSAADLNAAINYARAGNVEQATVYMKRAAADPERRVAVEDLRQVLGVPRW